MTLKSEWKKLAAIAIVFAACYWLPVEAGRFRSAAIEALRLVRWYAREHVLGCLVPAFFIAGAIAVFVSGASVMKYLGAGANKLVAYGVAGVSGAVMAVCSCTVLPLFAGIYRMGAGIGPATAFLYAGPAVNVLAIILTARVLGAELGIARAVGAVAFSVLVGGAMQVIFGKAEAARVAAASAGAAPQPIRPLWQTGAFFAVMTGVLVFANWSVTGTFPFGVQCCPGEGKRIERVVEGSIVEDTPEFLRVRQADGGVVAIDKDLLHLAVGTRVYFAIHRRRLLITGLLVAVLAAMLWGWFGRGELSEWVGSTWGFARQILPLLLIGVLAAGFLLGHAGRGTEGIVPAEWVRRAVGGNSLRANLLASVAGAFMYFATLTEVPILRGLLGNGMGKGPALALLLAGPALSLPNMLVIRSVMGTKKTLVYVLLVVVMSTAAGVIFGAIWR